MKKLRLVALLCCFVLLGISFNSCLDNNGPSIGNWWVGIATLKPLDEGDFYLQLDDSTTIKAVNNYIPHFLYDFRLFLPIPLLPMPQRHYDDDRLLYTEPVFLQTLQL